jgi:tetratricopeptide (TPR) repeat protein
MASSMRSPAVVARRGALAALLFAGVCCSGGPETPPVEEPVRPHDSLETILVHADRAFREGDLDEAQNAYEEAVRVAPDDGHVAAALGTCYLKNRLTRRADDLLTGYLSRHPADTAARLVLARVYIRESGLEKASEALRMVLRGDPDSLMAHYNLGLVAYKLRRFDEADEHLRRTIALKPEHPEAHYTLGLTEMARGRYAEAIAELKQAIAIDPKHVGANFNLVAAYARSGRAQEAERQQRVYAALSGQSKTMEEHKSQIASQSVHATQLVLGKKYPEALAEYESLAARFPDYAPFRHQIGLIQLRLGRRAEALESLKKAVALDPRLSDPHYLLWSLYREMGDEQAAAREMSIFATLETIPEGKSGY